MQRKLPDISAFGQAAPIVFRYSESAILSNLPVPRDPPATP
jgi:hypothetical protein